MAMGWCFGVTGKATYESGNGYGYLFVSQRLCTQGLERTAEDGQSSWAPAIPVGDPEAPGIPLTMMVTWERASRWKTSHSVFMCTCLHFSQYNIDFQINESCLKYMGNVNYGMYYANRMFILISFCKKPFEGTWHVGCSHQNLLKLRIQLSMHYD